MQQDLAKKLELKFFFEFLGTGRSTDEKFFSKLKFDYSINILKQTFELEYQLHIA